MEEKYYTRDEVSGFPHQPGVYQFYDQQKKLIYVGKAKNLKKRVTSYFNKNNDLTIKVRKMVGRIRFINFILVNSEYEALLLENNLIKRQQPYYNILLKDGKSFPYLCITQEPFPRLISTRQLERTRGVYFGPFTSVQQMEQIQELISQLYPLRTCRYDLSAANLAKKKFRVCLEYHIGNCRGPCEGRQSAADYQVYIDQLHHLLKGNFHQVKKELKATAQKLADQREYLQAHAYQQKLKAIEKYQAKSIITNPRLGNLDVITLSFQPDHVFVHYLYVQQGAIIFSQNLHIKRKLTETAEEVLAHTYCHFRTMSQSTANQVLTSHTFGPLPEGIELVIPQQGDKRKLLELAFKNLFFFEKSYLNEKTKQKRLGNRVLMRLQQDLGLREVPMHIECFDNSNLQGYHPVAAMVCYKKGLPAKRYYRHFHIKSVEGPNDFASMHEVIHRHYENQIESHESLPDLILIDGGKGQLTAAHQALQKLGIANQVALIAIAKKLELIYRVGDPHPLYINKKSPSLKLLQGIRDEAHRFAITFHRQTRSKKALKSELDDIPHIGPKTITKLLQHFGDLDKIKHSSLTEIAALIGMAKAQKLYSYFHERKKP